MRNLWILSGFAVFASIGALSVAIIVLIMYGYHAHEDAFDDESIHLVDRGEFTVDMVLDAVEFYEDEGREATVARYNDPANADGEWYVFVFDEQGYNIAHINPEILGQNLKDDLGTDSTGYRFGDSILAATGRGHWVDYVYENPVTGNQEYKHAWVVKRNGLIFGSGWYQVLPRFE